MALFGHEHKKNDKKGNPPTKILREACDRNTPICIVRPEQIGRVPMARGRLLKLHADGIDIDKVQIPGLDAHFSRSDTLDAYFSMGRTLYHFRTQLLNSSEPKRLNKRMLILGMTIAVPASLEQGDRRSLYRVPLSGREERVLVELWRPDFGEEEPHTEDDTDQSDENQTLPALAFNVRDLELAEIVGEMERKPDHTGWLADASEHGFGLRLEYVLPQRFHVFEPILIRLKMPDGKGEIVHLCEVRVKRAVGEEGTRLGVVIINGADQGAKREKAAMIRGYLNQIQRDHLRRMRDRAG